ncbi:hypothetical protein INT45_008318 [Circinella minor]|uniref:Uncharacterized protein n=1 Tax=Circinella minor TaxID=1195481 RepID=A0A8H7VPW1_9FUNG|nr:hypothetical protein INT45_008318 [Circinella minor]
MNDSFHQANAEQSSNHTSINITNESINETVNYQEHTDFNSGADVTIVRANNTELMASSNDTINHPHVSNISVNEANGDVAKAILRHIEHLDESEKKKAVMAIGIFHPNIFYRPDISNSVTLKSFLKGSELPLLEKAQKFVEDRVDQLQQLQEEQKELIHGVYEHMKCKMPLFKEKIMFLESVLGRKKPSNQEVKETNNIQELLDLVYSTLNNTLEDQLARQKLHFTNDPSRFCQQPLFEHALWYFEQQKYCTDFFEQLLGAVIYLEDNDFILMDNHEGLSFSYMLCVLVNLLIGCFHHPIDTNFIAECGFNLFRPTSHRLSHLFEDSVMTYSTKRTSLIDPFGVSFPSLATIQELGISMASYKPNRTNCFVPQGAVQIITYSNEHDGVIQIAILSLLDLRYNYKNFRNDSSDIFPVGWVEGYFADTMVTLYYLVPDFESYQIAVSIGLVPDHLHIDWEWWGENIIANGIFYTKELKFYIPGSAMVCQMKALCDLYENRRQSIKTINTLKTFSTEKVTYLKFLYPNIESWDNAVAANRGSLESLCEQAQTSVALVMKNICARYEYNVTWNFLYGPPYNVFDTNSNDNDDNIDSSRSNTAKNKIKTFDDLIQLACNQKIDSISNGSTLEGNNFYRFHINTHEMRYSILPLLELFFNQGSIFPALPFMIFQSMLDILSHNIAEEDIMASRRFHTYFSNCIIPALFGTFYGRIPPDFWSTISDIGDSSKRKKRKNVNTFFEEDYLIKIPSFDELDKAGFLFEKLNVAWGDYPDYNNDVFQLYRPWYSLSNFCNIKMKSTGIKIFCMIPVSALDLRYNYRNFDALNDSELYARYSIKRTEHATDIQGYFADFMYILGFLIPNEPSFDIALSNGILPSQVSLDWRWWKNNILASRDYYQDLQSESDFAKIGEQTFRQLQYLGIQFLCLKLSATLSPRDIRIAPLAITFFHPDVSLYQSNLPYYSVHISVNQASKKHKELCFQRRIDDFQDIESKCISLMQQYNSSGDSFLNRFLRSFSRKVPQARVEQGQNRLSITNHRDIYDGMEWKKFPVFGATKYEFIEDVLEVPFDTIITTASQWTFGSGTYSFYNTLLGMLHLVRVIYGANHDSERIIYFSDLVEIMIGDFNGLLFSGWIRLLPSTSKKTSTVNFNDLKVPSLGTFSEKGFSIQAAVSKKQLKNGISVSVTDKIVEMQSISLLDLRLIHRDDHRFHIQSNYCSGAMKQLIDYYYDSLMKLSKLIPDQQSFDIAVKANIISISLGIDWAWWHREIIEVMVRDRIDEKGNVDMGKETTELLRSLERKFRQIAYPTTLQTMLDKLKNNSPHVVYVTLVLLFTALSLIQVLQGFDVFTPSSSDSPHSDDL